MTEAIENKTEQAEAVVVEKPYTFRPLQAEDTFLMCKVIKAIGIKEFKACFEDGGIQEMVAQRDFCGLGLASSCEVSIIGFTSARVNLFL